MSSVSALQAQIQGTQIDAPTGVSGDLYTIRSAFTNGCSINSAFKALTAIVGVAGAAIGAVEAFEQQFAPSPPAAPPPPTPNYARQGVIAMSGLRVMGKTLGGDAFSPSPILSDGSTSFSPAMAYLAPINCPTGIQATAVANGVAACSSMLGSNATTVMATACDA